MTPLAQGTEILPPLDQRPAADGRREPAVLATASFVHDLGNLIQIASSAINIIARTPDMPVRHAAPMVDRARLSLEHAGELVHQKLGRVRATAGEHSDVAACLSNVAVMVGALGEPGLTLRLAIEPDLPEARCDSIGLRRAILNLVLNARDAMASKGMVMIRARALPDGTIEIRVGDHGVGMSQAMIARMFDPFFTTKKDGLGGIGLPMVERFVRDAGGTLAIASEPGIGTTVTLRLPGAMRPETPSEEICS